MKFKGSEIDGTAANSGKSPLICGNAYGNERITPGIDRRAAGEQGNGLGRPAVVPQRTQDWVKHAHLVMVDSVSQPSRVFRADQVVLTGRVQGDHGCEIARCCMS